MTLPTREEHQKNRMIDCRFVSTSKSLMMGGGKKEGITISGRRLQAIGPAGQKNTLETKKRWGAQKEGKRQHIRPIRRREEGPKFRGSSQLCGCKEKNQEEKSMPGDKKEGRNPTRSF